MNDFEIEERTQIAMAQFIHDHQDGLLTASRLLHLDCIGLFDNGLKVSQGW